MIPTPTFLVSLSSAQPTTGIETALQGLCLMSQSFLGILAMLLIIIGPVTALIGFGIMLLTKGKHKTAELGGKIVLGLGILLSAGAVLSILIYLLTPWILSILLGVPVSPTGPCDFNL